jgi:predicted RNA binding protein YcfA (HicA-like mRNA interferase family)
MSKLPVCSGAAAVRAFKKAGWSQDRQKGSHVTMTKPDSPVVLTIPQHRELGPGLLRSLIRQSGLSVEQFTALL